MSETASATIAIRVVLHRGRTGEWRAGQDATEIDDGPLLLDPAQVPETADEREALARELATHLRGEAQSWLEQRAERGRTSEL